ncbi:MAG: hypothetical protein NC253_03295 [Ruminococcus sp.]|nr:hypothetical protein [Ruminococcus sp.]
MTNTINTNANTYYGGGATQTKTKKSDSIDPSLIKHEGIPKDAVVTDFGDYMVEQGYFSSKEEFYEYIRGADVFPGEENSTAAQTFSKAKVIEINGQKYFEDGTPIANVDLFKSYKLSYEITPTGDHEHDYQLQMGLNYNITCVDDKNWQDYEELTAAEDFTGMSAAEIYKAIYEKYKHCYGENFLDINAVPYVSASGFDSFRGLIGRFNGEIRSACGIDEDIANIRREALYGDMSDYDVRAAIIEKYTSGRKPTNADLYKITAEFDRCGVGGGIHNPLTSVLTTDRSQVLHNSSLGIKTSVEDACALREAMLASPADSYMLDGIVRHSTGMGTANAKLYSALDQLREACEAFSDGISLGTVNTSGTKDDFVWIKL